MKQERFDDMRQKGEANEHPWTYSVPFVTHLRSGGNKERKRKKGVELIP